MFFPNPENSSNIDLVLIEITPKKKKNCEPYNHQVPNVSSQKRLPVPSEISQNTAQGQTTRWNSMWSSWTRSVHPGDAHAAPHATGHPSSRWFSWRLRSCSVNRPKKKHGDFRKTPQFKAEILWYISGWFHVSNWSNICAVEMKVRTNSE